MHLFELFDQTGVQDQLKQSALDLLTPLVASKVPFVTVQQVIDELRNTRPGIMVDRSLIMSLLDPDNLKCIQKIEGDRIYLQQPVDDQRKVDDNQAEKDAEKVHNTAQNQAKDAVADKA